MKNFNQIKSMYSKMPLVTKASIWFIICGFLQRGISTLTTPIFTRLLTPEEYGTYSVFNFWLEIITIFATLRLVSGVYVKGLVKFSDDKDKFSSSLLGLATIWCTGVFIIYLIFHDFWNNLFGLSTTMMICMFIMMLSIISFNFWAAQQKNELKYSTLIKFTLLISILKPLSGIFAILCWPVNKVEARIISIAIVELLVYLGLYIRIFVKGKTFFDLKYWKYALSFNLPLIPHFLSQIILNHSDCIMIQKLVSLEAAGIYSLAYSLAMFLTILNTSIQNAIKPWTFHRLKAKEFNKIDSMGISSLIFVSICNLLLISFAPELLSIFSPSTYGNAIVLIPPITMGVYFAYLYNMFVDIQIYYEKTSSVMKVAIICSIFNIISNFILIPKFGYSIAAYTTLLSYILMSILHYFSMKKILLKNNICTKIYPIKKIIFISLIFMFMGTIMGFLFKYLYIRLLIVCVLVFILFIKRKVVMDFLKIILNNKK